ncbi:MAG: DUF3048 domain-containing protein [Bifidobacteriaceae bacterium]|jgi:hypothetical protein|nr:DUF3048 domain-containing protein [Bifidobacteriaceae bacterium]
MFVSLPHSLRLPRALAAALVLALAGAGLAACGHKEPNAVTKVEDSAIEADKNAPPEVPAVWPLTALPGEVQARPALAVKVENPAVARPQSGLEQADMVWEEMVEGGESRFIAVFNSQAPQAIGPVRSIRPMDGPILGATGGVLACSGGQARFIDLAKGAGLQVLTEDSGGAGFFRSTDRSMPHNLYLNAADAWSQADGSHQQAPKPDFLFADSAAAATAAKDGRSGISLAVRISAVAKPNWTWDEATKTYLRSEGDVPSDSASGVRLAAHNVIALAVPIEMAGGTDSAGSPIPDTRIVGSGSGVILVGGKALDVDWSKASDQDRLILKVAGDGAEVKLAPGVTWIELVPLGDGNWTVS